MKLATSIKRHWTDYVKPLTNHAEQNFGKTH